MSLNGVSLSSATNFVIGLRGQFLRFRIGRRVRRQRFAVHADQTAERQRARRLQHAPPVLEDMARRDFAARNVVAGN